MYHFEHHWQQRKANRLDLDRLNEMVMETKRMKDMGMANWGIEMHMYESMYKSLDYFGVTENAVSSKEDTYIRSVVDQKLELIDPTPNIHTMFVQFDLRFFNNALSSVPVKWSNRMKCAAGMCRFNSRNKECVISLSAPLLKLRPRKDLVETLLHEMIHAYLFLTNNDKDRDGHGPSFCKLMNKINEEAGTNITVYHDFHDEVELYKQHWWKCNGPCQNKPPFFGMIRRSMNRAPDSSDFWWKEHKQSCNGEFIKIKEPENFKSRSKQKSNKSNESKDRRITDWFPKSMDMEYDMWREIGPTSSKSLSNDSKIFTQTDNAKPSTSKDNDGINSPRALNEKDTPDLSLGMKKLGNSSNNVHGWGISGPSENAKKDGDRTNYVFKSPKFSCSGVLGGSSGQSNLLSKFKKLNNDKSPRKFKDSALKFSWAVEENDPVLNSTQPRNKRDLASISMAAKETTDNNPVLNPSQPRNNSVPCPMCNIPLTAENMYIHIDSCLIDNTSLIDEINNNVNNNNNNEELMLPIRTFSTSVTEQNVDADTIVNKRLKSDNSNETIECVTCPVCKERVPDTDINQHLDECLLKVDTACKAAIPSTSSASFNDSLITVNSSSNSDLDDSVLIEDPQPSTSTCNNDVVDFERKCLVCNAKIAPEISLNEHLEECIGSVFNDDTIIIDDKEDDDTLAIENNSTENKYPCPVCMQIISENLMNQHLDMCLKNE